MAGHEGSERPHRADLSGVEAAGVAECAPTATQVGIGNLSVVQPLSDPVLLPLWQVTLTVAGKPTDAPALAEALEALVHERPFMMAIRYAKDRAELRYWDEAEDVDDAAALALRLWGDHRRSCALPAWRVVGIEVIDRATVQARRASGFPSRLISAGVSPM